VDRLGNISARMGSVLALLAALSAVLLPAGQMPKVAGPCGRALCECPAQVVPTSAENVPTCHDCSATKNVAVRKVLTLSQTSVSATESSGLAFQFVFSGMFLPQRNVVTCDSFCKKTPACGELFSIAAATFDIDVPPPRA
jgi:hypothetical protein